VIGSLLLIGALVCFVLAATGIARPWKIDLTALGLALWVMPQVLARFI
jgi:hypothetical protein